MSRLSASSVAAFVVFASKKGNLSFTRLAKAKDAATSRLAAALARIIEPGDHPGRPNAWRYVATPFN